MGIFSEYEIILFFFYYKNLGDLCVFAVKRFYPDNGLNPSPSASWAWPITTNAAGSTS
jgi:hypothetical protein